MATTRTVNLLRAVLADPDDLERSKHAQFAHGQCSGQLGLERRFGGSAGHLCAWASPEAE